MPQDKPHLQHLTSSKSLVTTYEETRAGFVSLALERNRRATPFIEEARSLKAAASQAVDPSSLIHFTGIQAALLTAAGVSDKAAGHMEQQDKQEAIQGLIEHFLEPAGLNFVEELVFRFLLTRGDALGGSMRNVGGAVAQRKLTRAIIATLSIAGISFQWLSSKSNVWIQGTENDPDIELDVKGLSWSNNGQNRTVRYNLTVPFLKKNVDLCLFNCSYQEISVSYKNPALYVALGELKGGIDPAGADEHWKTASTSLSRIRDAFTSRGLSPQLFFVGAAIENSMSEEIWNQLENSTLGNAANLTDANQVASLCRWLCNLCIVKSHSGNRLNPIKDYFLSTLRYRPGITNLRSSVFICGLFFAAKLETKIPLQKGTRMTRIKRIFTDNPICANPRHPRYPCSIVALLSEHFHTTIQEYNYEHNHKQNDQ